MVAIDGIFITFMFNITLFNLNYAQ